MRMAQSILQRMARVRGRGYVSILLRARSFFVNQGGTADKVLFVLDKVFLSGAFFNYGFRSIHRSSTVGY